MIILVTGGRDYMDPQAVYAALEMLDTHYPISAVVHGDARGADRLASLWAVSRDIPHYPCRADWDGYGNRAGPVRNSQMLLGPDGPYGAPRPEYCVAFPGGNGTADMVRKATDHGLTVWQPYPAERRQ